MRITVAFLFLAGGVLQAASPGVFTAAQAAAGKAAYESTCIACHTASLIPAADAKTQAGARIPPLAGAEFLAKWGSKPARSLANRIDVAISGFPPKGMTAKTYLDIAAYVLQVNGGNPGPKDLEPTSMVEVRKVTADSRAR